MLPVHLIPDLPAPERRFHRLSGRACLDLLATIGERWRRRFERLMEPADLERWLRGAELLDGEADVGETDLAAARRLRGAIEELVTGVLEERAPSAMAIAIVNEVAALPVRTPHLAAGAVTRRVPPGSSEVETALAELARDAIELFGSGAGRRVRECAADDCALVFLDVSRSGVRRWCSMRGCGNRAKVARHRSSSVAGPSTEGPEDHRG